MATSVSQTKPLVFNLYEEWDEENEIVYKGILNSLVAGTTTPSQAATAFDKWIVNDSYTRHANLMKRDDPRYLTSEEEAQGLNMNLIKPNPTGELTEVFKVIGTLFTALAPYSTEQNAVFDFLEALRAMPRHKIPSSTPWDDEEDCRYMELWNFGHDEFCYTEELRRVDEGKIGRFHGWFSTISYK